MWRGNLHFWTPQYCCRHWELLSVKTVADARQASLEINRVRIVGCGNWGAKHIRNFRDVGEAHQATVCDVNRRTVEMVRNQYNYVKTTSNFMDPCHDSMDVVV